MKAYHGRIRIRCERGDKGCPQRFIENVSPACLYCDLCAAEVIDLAGEKLQQIAPGPKRAKKGRGAKPKRTTTGGG